MLSRSPSRKSFSASPLASRFCLAVATICLAHAMFSCGSSQSSSQTPASASTNNSANVTSGGTGSAPLLINPTHKPKYNWHGIDGRTVSNDTALGKLTVVAFVSTFDWASQAQARFISSVARDHIAKPYCFAVAVEQPENEPLIESFVSTLSLPYPVVHLPSNKLKTTDFRSVTSVPTVWILNPTGIVVWKSNGLATDSVIADVLHQIDESPATRPSKSP